MHIIGIFAYYTDDYTYSVLHISAFKLHIVAYGNVHKCAYFALHILVCTVH